MQARRHFKSGKSKYLLIAAGAALSVGTGAGVLTSAGVARADQAASSALDGFMNRSPGERIDGLIQIKKAVRAALTGGTMGSDAAMPDGAAPEQRALGKIFDTPAEDAVNELGVPTALLPNAPVGLPNLLDALDDASSGGVLPSFGGGNGILTPPGGGGGGGGGIITSPIGGAPPVEGGESGSGDPGVGSVDVVVTSVPEPASWVLMIFGMFATANAMRRRPRQRRMAFTPCAGI